jgi:hypothetical protein
MKWIHVECLNQWRRASKKESRYDPFTLCVDTSFFRCDECRHEYSFRINSAYLLTTRRSPQPPNNLICSNPNSADVGNFYRDGIHARHSNQTSSLFDKNPNRNPPTNNLHSLLALITPARPLFPAIRARCIQLPRSSTLGLWSYNARHTWLHADAFSG